MSSTKKRILFCTESSHIKSGYGNYTGSVLSRLYDLNKYEIAELSCYRTVEHVNNCPWKVYPNAVSNKDSRYSQYQANISNGFGQWRFDLVVADFKPDIVVDFRDIFMTTFQRTSVFRNKFHWILAPTIDSFPIKNEWLDLVQHCDTLLTHTNWAKDSIENIYQINVSGVVKDSIDTSIFKPMNKIACRNQLGLDLDAVIIGSVMRNQKRKLIPDLFKVIADLNKKHSQSIYLYMHTSYPETMGWDIPSLLLEHDIYDLVLFTYLCKSCGHWQPMQWKGSQCLCPKCNKLQMLLSSVSKGLGEKDLAKIYNTFDVYIQYATCEGFGIPPLEAAACGIPFCAIDHGAMKELVNDIGGYSIPVAATFRDYDNGSDRAYPDNEACVDIVLDLLQKTGDHNQYEQASITQKHHSWDYTTKVYEQIIDSIHTQDPARWEPIPEIQFQNTDKQIKQTNNNREFIYDIVDNILQESWLKSSFFIQQLIMALDNGYILSDNGAVPFKQPDALKALEMWFNNKAMLHKFLSNPEIIKQNDFLVYQ